MRNVITIAIMVYLASTWAISETKILVNLERYCQTDKRTWIDIGIRQECPEGRADTVIVWSASWCVPCKEMKPIWEKLKEQGYKVIYVDADNPPKWAKDLRPKSLPFIRFWNSDTRKWLKTSYVGKQTLQTIKKSLWKPLSLTDLPQEH